MQIHQIIQDKHFDPSELLKEQSLQCFNSNAKKKTLVDPFFFSSIINLDGNFKFEGFQFCIKKWSSYTP